ncbi:hypothetical protein CF15_05620 [Pyrodictium occultum]|uniref:Uncharacterized protein n=1 Tax=Pyrodictium occultum TaxID=2309 RepID=A0A0V8RW34_PYROC|nr:hypothetical protein CF15_05620 [Pyrodictium occultum]
MINGLEAVERLLEEYRRRIYRYNSLIRGTGFYLKPMHIVTKNTPEGKRTYYYIGRYWWRVLYQGKSGSTSRVKWIYVGREKPRELEGYPDPPEHPVAGLRFTVEGRDIILDRRVYEKYRWVFEGYEAVEEPE